MDNYEDYFKKLLEVYSNGQCDTLIPLMSIFNLNGKPYTLQKHWMMEPFFDLNRPKRRMFKCARQVGKSQQLGSGVILDSIVNPYFRNLIVAPRFEQVKRLSKDIIEPYINQSNIRNYIIDPKINQSVFRREFKNNSVAYFAHAFLSPDNVRGLSNVASMFVDESIRGSTNITVIDINTGDILSRKITDIKNGDFILTYDPVRGIITSVVNKNSYHGKRNCFKITLKNGDTLSGTTDHLIPTTRGWLRLGEIIDYVYNSSNKKTTGGSLQSTTNSADIGYNVRGRLYHGRKGWIEKLSNEPWLPSKRLYESQVPDITRVRYRETQESEERRLRGILYSMANKDFSDLQLFTLPDVCRKSKYKNSDQELKSSSERMVRYHRLGRTGLLDNGRRQSRSKKILHYKYSQFRRQRNGNYKSMAQREVRDKKSYYEGKQKPRRWNSKNIQCSLYPNKKRIQVMSKYKTTCPRMYGIQSRLVRPSVSSLWKSDIQTNFGVFERMYKNNALNPQTYVLSGKQRILGSEEQGMGFKQSRTGEGHVSSLQRPTQRRRRIQSEKMSRCESLRRKDVCYRRGKAEDSRPEECLEPIRERESFKKENRQSVQGAFEANKRGSISNSTFQREIPTDSLGKYGEISRIQGLLPSPESYRQFETETEKTNRYRSIIKAAERNRRSYNSERDGEKSLEFFKEDAQLCGIDKIEYDGYHDVYDLEVEGTRTFFANNIAVHNCQDINHTFFPILAETMSANEHYGFHTYTGTPKSIENGIELLWKKSSQASWTTQCEHCNKYNIADIETDLLDMIGKDTVICKKCGKPLDCSKGFYLHKFPDRRSSFAGYEISQPVHPVHYLNETKWHELLYKMENYPKAQFYNECLGISYDSSIKLMTISDLLSCTNSKLKNDLKDAKNRMCNYHTTVIGIDWSGGGDSASYTKIALGGMVRGTDQIEIIYSEAFPKSMNPIEENQLLIERIKYFKPTLIGHDYGGAGNVREMGLLHEGIPAANITPFTYVCSYDKDVVSFSPANVSKSRATFNVDKARSLVILCTMMKAGKILIHDWNPEDDSDNMLDFIHLQEEVQKGVARGDVYRVGCTPGCSDDLCHAINYVCSTLWIKHGCYPNIADALKYKVTKQQFEKLVGNGSKAETLGKNDYA